MTGVTRSRGARRAARARPPATSRLLLAACYAVFLALVPASLAADVSNGTALLAAVNDGTVGSIRLVANVTTPFAWTQAGVFITRDLVIESDTDVCGGDGCHVFGHDSRDFVRVANGATVTMRKIILDDHGDHTARSSMAAAAYQPRYRPLNGPGLRRMSSCSWSCCGNGVTFDRAPSHRPLSYEDRWDRACSRIFCLTLSGIAS